MADLGGGASGARPLYFWQNLIKSAHFSPIWLRRPLFSANLPSAPPLFENPGSAPEKPTCNIIIIKEIYRAQTAKLQRALCIANAIEIFLGVYLVKTGHQAPISTLSKIKILVLTMFQITIKLMFNSD